MIKKNQINTENSDLTNAEKKEIKKEVKEILKEKDKQIDNNFLASQNKKL